jgi:hypothetical protein
MVFLQVVFLELQFQGLLVFPLPQQLVVLLQLEVFLLQLQMGAEASLELLLVVLEQLAQVLFLALA